MGNKYDSKETAEERLYSSLDDDDHELDELGQLIYFMFLVGTCSAQCHFPL